MRTGMLVALAGAVLFGAPAAAVAQDCGKGRAVLKKLQLMVEKVADEVGCTYIQAQTGVPKPLCKAGAKVTHKMEKLLNEKLRAGWRKLAKNSWATIGPRELKWGKKEKGTLRGTFARMFISAKPVTKKRLQIVVKKTDGKGKARVAICGISPKTGKVRKLATHTFPRGKSKKTWKHTVKNAFGMNIMVHIDGKTAVRKFAYSVKATPKK
jgi:hypothetical protein